MAQRPKSSSNSLLDDAFGGASAQARTDALPFPMTVEEQTAYEKLFRIADAENKNVITPQTAYEFLSKSKLPQTTLSEIWTAADSEKRGFLTRTGFFKALKYIALAQTGRPVSSGLNGATPLPALEGITGPVASHRTGDKAAANASFELTDSEKDRFQTAFLSCKPANGTVSGEAARDVFLKSGLPTDPLSKIWTLVDTSGSGRLNQNQFMVAMYLISKLRSGALSQVPPSVPQALWNIVALAVSPPASPMPTLARTPPSTPGPANGMPRPSQTPQAMTPQSAAGDSWAVPMADRTSYTAYFEKLDVGNRGYLTGEDAYQFFVKSKLQEVDLHRVWDLSDVNKAGRLTKDEFILAMFLINMRMAGQDLPLSLPSNLIPPSSKSMSNRNPSTNSLGIAASLPFPTSNMVSPAPRSSVTQERDLLSLDVDPFSPRAATAFPPLSSLGTTPSSMALPTVGLGNTAADVQAREKELTMQKQQLADTQSQLSTMGPATEELRTRRTALDLEYNQVMETKRQQTVKLAQARAMFEAENVNVGELEAALSRELQIAELSRQELAAAEANRETLKTQAEGITAALNQARADAAEVQRRVKDVTDQANTIRAQIDALRNERQQQSTYITQQQQVLSGTTEAIESLRLSLQQENQRLQEDQKRANAIATQVVAQTSLLEKERASHNVQMSSIGKERSDLAQIIAAAEHQKAAAEEALKKLGAEKSGAVSKSASVASLSPVTPASAPVASSAPAAKSVVESASSAPTTPAVAKPVETVAPAVKADDSLASFDQRFPDIGSAPAAVTPAPINTSAPVATKQATTAPAVKAATTPAATTTPSAAKTTTSPPASKPTTPPSTPAIGNGTAKVAAATAPVAAKIVAPTTTTSSTPAAVGTPIAAKSTEKDSLEDLMSSNQPKKVAPAPPPSKAGAVKSPESSKPTSPTGSGTSTPIGTSLTNIAPAAAKVATTTTPAVAQSAAVAPTTAAAAAAPVVAATAAKVTSEPPMPPQATKPSKAPGASTDPTTVTSPVVAAAPFEANFDEAFKNPTPVDTFGAPSPALTASTTTAAKKAVNVDIDKELSGLQGATVVDKGDVFADDLKANDAFTFDPSFKSTGGDDPFAAFDSKSNGKGGAGDFGFEDAFAMVKGHAGAGGSPTDDVEQMKTLLDMGYTREQAVGALDKSDYQLDKALELLMK
ncbi:hypothetical protein SmJEL517_g03714 [Synchytrium microbalum]|uniref:Uncharacterized protein n=1 Tax=Synchytrium microbalum TaxID=1806994 RepID=A0A507BV64_9FUNG|nr:uncharacterized protein SmJEL517_g03714 [Synchytrium microbalum]TPX33310.1 hypothetical protein SmJEL517_g03714 [Synchytrium microbalum]